MMFLIKVFRKMKRILKKLKNLPKKLKNRKYLYAFFYNNSRIVRNRILFASFHGQEISDSSYAMLLELMNREECGEYEIYFASCKAKLGEHRRFVSEHHLPVRLVTIESVKYLRILASAHYLIHNNSFPAYYIRKDGQIYLQTWHGTPLKTLGKQMREGLESMYYAQHSLLQASYILFPNRLTRNVLMQDYNLEKNYTGKTVYCGYPRNSVFFNEKDKAGIRSRYGLEGKTVFAYMPTWRGASTAKIDKKYEDELRGILDRLDQRLTDDQLFYVNFHQMMRGMKGLDNYRHIRQFPQEVNNYAFLNCADVLVTDYSSVMFDFSITQKPIILFTYDYDQYMRERGMSFDIRDLPFQIASTERELWQYLDGSRPIKGDYGHSAYFDQFICYDTPDTPAKMLDLVLHGKEDGLDITDYSANGQTTRRIVRPGTMKDAADLETLSRFVQENDIVLFRRKGFNQKLRDALIETYNDRLNYIITTDASIITYYELLMWKLGSEKVKQKVRARERRRVFPGLLLEENDIRSILVPETGCSVRMAKAKKADAVLKQEGSGFRMTLSEPDLMELRKILIVDKHTHIVLSIDTEANEWTGDILALAELLPEPGNYLIGAEILVKETDASPETLRYALFKDPVLNGKSIGTIHETGVTDVFFEPLEAGTDEETGKKTAVTMVPYPHAWMKGFHIVKSDSEQMLDKEIWASVVSYSSKGNAAQIGMVVPAIPGLAVESVLLVHRGPDKTAYEVPFTWKAEHSLIRIRARIDFPEVEFKPIYWDPYVQCEWNGVNYRIRVHMPSQKWKYRFFLENRQYDLDEKFIVFPHYWTGSFLTFIYRERTRYDGRAHMFKEMAALAVYKLFGRALRRKRIWLVFEKQSNSAQDNGYYFFKYCMEQLPEEKRKKIFFILKKDSPDWSHVSCYGKQVIPYMSFRHLVYLLSAKLLVASESKMHVYVWRAKTSLIRKYLRKKKICFLQHGVTALKQDHNLFGANSGYPMTYFVTTSQFEHDIIEQNFGYQPENIPITGFSRWDVLEDKCTGSERTVLIMPTWRAWLEDMSDEDFKRSEYYQSYSALLEDEDLAALLERKNCNLLFYLHPKFADMYRTFSQSRNERIRLVPFGEEPLNEIMMHSRMLITDYSSVCWDMYYMKKPVLFYQFDLDLYNEVWGSYIDMRTELFGQRTENRNELICLLEQVVDGGFRMSDKDLLEYPHYFAYTDDQNSARIYGYLESRNN